MTYFHISLAYIPPASTLRDSFSFSLPHDLLTLWWIFCYPAVNVSLSFEPLFTFTVTDSLKIPRFSIFALVRLKKRNKFRFFFLDVCILEIKTVLLARYCMYVLKICCEHTENLFGFCNIFSDYLKRSCGYSRWVWLTCWGYHSVCCQCTSPSDENILSAPHAWPAQTHHNKPVSLCACQT